MLKSVVLQTWNNIEVILVNDGSTDDTRLIISCWEEKFKARGYTVHIIDQDNAGVAAAIKKGFDYAEGDYVCFPDADDYITPDYVRLMANELDNNADIGFVACEIGIRDRLNGTIIGLLDFGKLGVQPEKRIERGLLIRLPMSVCNLLLRRELIIDLKIFTNMCIYPAVSQEPQILIPLYTSSSKGMELHIPLYIYNTYAKELGATLSKNPLDMILNDYYSLQVKTIDSLDITDSVKDYLKKISIIGDMICSMQIMNKNERERSKDKLYDKIKELVTPYYPITNDLLDRGGTYLLLHAISNSILGIKRRNLPSVRKSVISYGSLGNYASLLTPHIVNTPLNPRVYWDKSANEGTKNYMGEPVTCIDGDIVMKDDIILCFPNNKAIYAEAKSIADKKNAIVLSYYDIMDIMSSYYYPQFYEHESITKILQYSQYL